MIHYRPPKIPARDELTYKCDPPLGFNLDCSRWLHRQLKNCSFLTFCHTVQERYLTVWKFQRIMMSRNLFLVDLPKDCRLVPDHLISQHQKRTLRSAAKRAHSITSSARPIRAFGTMRPSALAVITAKCSGFLNLRCLPIR